jgi:Mor family transcriptional regulator
MTYKIVGAKVVYFKEAPKKENPDKKRNEKILALKVSGKSVATIAKKYRLSEQRIAQIIKQYSRPTRFSIYNN